ncbi:MAG TPA: DUF3843 family protein [Planctomycetota bacterium]|nr:DUF3843 family protein [Planctomycetota bacterium]
MSRLDRPTLKLSKLTRGELSWVLVEHMEDLHCGMGLWNSLEIENRANFRTPLPLIVRPPVEPELKPDLASRIRHVLYVILPQLVEGLLLSPDHVDLIRIADDSADFLRKAFAGLPNESGVQKFLGSSTPRGWDAKRKLVWLGTHSYLCRDMFRAYVEREGKDQSDIGLTDDFICQECTEWSGLAPVDFLAGTLDIHDSLRVDLRSWSQRHFAFYRVQKSGEKTIHVQNLINSQDYAVRMDAPGNPFKEGCVVFGALVPWGGEWYWSGLQQDFGPLPESEDNSLRGTFLKHSSAIAYRYCPDRRDKARESLRIQREAFERRHGNDLKEYPDGLSMAADWQADGRERFAALPEGERLRVMARHGLKDSKPALNIPMPILDSQSGIGVYFNPQEGVEILPQFDLVKSALNKKGKNMTSEGAEMLVGVMQDQNLSPDFILRLIKAHGDESMRAAFLLERHPEPYVIDYLCRRYKGRFFKERYPNLNVVE